MRSADTRTVTASPDLPDPDEMRARHHQRRQGAFIIRERWGELFAVFVLPLGGPLEPAPESGERRA